MVEGVSKGTMLSLLATLGSFGIKLERHCRTGFSVLPGALDVEIALAAKDRTQS